MSYRTHHNSRPKLVLARLGVALFSLLALAAFPATAQNVHQLAYNGSWVDTNLTATTGGPTPLVGGLSAFYTSPDNDLHVFYAEQETQHIHQLTYKDYEGTWLWADEDVTNESNGTPATLQTAISAFTTNGAQYAYFCGVDNDLHEYAYGNNGDYNWVDTNVSQQAGGSPCYQGTKGATTISFVAFATSGQRHVFLEDPNGSDIYHYVFKGSVWGFEDDTELSGGEPGDGSYIAGFTANGAQYVFFEGQDANIHQLAYGVDGDYGWVDTNISSAAKASEAAQIRQAGVSAFNLPNTSEIEVYYVASKTYKVEQLTFNNKGKWTKVETPGQGPIEYAQMTAMATTPNNQFHVFFNGDVKKPGIYQDYYDGAWQNQLLESDTPWFSYGGATSGFAMGNSQYFFYVSNN
jgi:hypothetical protein